MEKHFHTLEIIALAGVVTALTFHAFRFGGGWLSKSGNPGVARAGSAIAGVFTFGAPTA